MSTILDALKKANDEKGHVRSAINHDGGLYEQTRIEPKAPVAQSSGNGVTTAAIAVGALLLTASVFIGVIIWASRTAGQQQQASPSTVTTAAAAAPAPQQSPPPQMQPEPPQANPAVIAPARDLEPPGQRRQGPRGLRYLEAERLPVVPIEVQPEELPPPRQLAHLDEEDLQWDEEEIDDSEIFDDDTSAQAAPAIAPPAHRLEGVIWDDANPLAIINGSIVGPGEYVAGAEVVSIEMDKVTILIDGRERTLRP